MDIEVGGQIQGISLGSFLQIVHMDKTTCTLKIYSNDDIGYLYLKDGALVAAEAGDLENVEAAYEILSWNKSVIIIDNAPIPDQKIEVPLMSILMEGLRRKDEKNAQMVVDEVEQKELEVEFDPETYVSRDDQIASQFVVDDGGSSSGDDAGPESFVADSAESKPPVTHPPGEKPPVQKDVKKELREQLEDQPEAEPQEKEPEQQVHFEGEEEAEEKRSVVSIFMRYMVLAVVLGSLTYGGLKGYDYYIGKRNYQRVISQVQSQKKLEHMKRVLTNYINSQDDGNRYIPDAITKLNDLNLLIEVERKVSMLSLDEDYKMKAGELYRDYLKERTNSFLKDYVQVKISDIPKILEAYEYKKLLSLSEKSRRVKMGAYRLFLQTYPGTKNKQSVQNMIAALGDESYETLIREIKTCNRSGDWERCLSLSNEFVADFPEDKRLPEILDVKQKMKDRMEFSDMTSRAGTMEFDDAKKMFIAYLQANPDTSMKGDIRDQITMLNRKIGFKDKWDETYAYCRNSKIPLHKRISELNDFIIRDTMDLFRAQSDALMTDLKEEEKIGRVRMAQILKERQEKDRLAKIQAEKDRLAREKEEARLAELRRIEREKRLAEETVRLTKILESSGGRFKAHSDRTVTDTRSGLLWSMIDSKIAEGECMDYDQARDYVKKMEVGGYKDWRMPDSGELAILYNSKPYYPSSGASWYWTITASERVWGQEQKAEVFFPDKKNEFVQVLKNQTECGYVHAVRP